MNTNYASDGGLERLLAFAEFRSRRLPKGEKAKRKVEYDEYIREHGRPVGGFAMWQHLKDLDEFNKLYPI